MSLSVNTSVAALRVLVVDDSAAVRERLVALLSEVAGVTVVGTAGSVVEAVLADTRLAPDAVVLDIRMPGGDGIAVLRAVKARSAGATVIMLTNYTAEGHRERCMAAGADSFLDKSADLDDLVGLVEELVARHAQDDDSGGTTDAVT